MTIRISRFLIIAAFLLPIFGASAQTLIVQNAINMPQDTAVRSQLIDAFYGFLKAKDHPNKENKYVQPESLPETSALLDELKGAEKSANRKDDNFYKCYLTNAVDRGNGSYLLQFSYIGVNDNAPVLRSSFRLIAHRNGNSFLFSSPLKEYTADWKTKTMGNITFHFADKAEKADMKAYRDAVKLYDDKLKAPGNPIEFYFGKSFTQIQQLLGVDYKLEFNGLKYDILGSYENNVNLSLSGWYDNQHHFDAHDLWHERLRNVVSSDVINRPVDEGCAYLYGGSWGYTWPEVWAKFKKYVAANPDADWLKLYTETTNFEAGDKPLKAGYVLNALIVQQIEKEKGFAAVMPLLTCGPREKGDANYFRELQKITGIDKAGFNAAMWKLIKEQK